LSKITENCDHNIDPSTLEDLLRIHFKKNNVNGTATFCRKKYLPNSKLPNDMLSKTMLPNDNLPTVLQNGLFTYASSVTEFHIMCDTDTTLLDTIYKLLS
jgi:hypothetical protein